MNLTLVKLPSWRKKSRLITYLVTLEADGAVKVSIKLRHYKVQIFKQGCTDF